MSRRHIRLKTVCFVELFEAGCGRFPHQALRSPHIA
jgi:hypothetical protein